MSGAGADRAERPISFAAPFRHSAFTVLWTATLVSNVPALGGLTISAYGIVAPFWINAASNLGIVASLLWWRPRTRAGTLLPAERFGQAILAGLRYARHNQHLQATLARAAGFFLFASAYWALLPLVARQQIGD